MKHLIYYDRQGRVTRLAGLPDGMQPDPAPGERFLLSDEYRSCDNKYVDNGQLCDMTPCPSSAHDFDWTRKTWKLNAARSAQQARERRNALLAACDWTQLPDVDLKTKTAWATYRQALRDVTEQPGFPTTVQWPTPPA
jgi:hypothetical protein